MYNNMWCDTQLPKQGFCGFAGLGKFKGWPRNNNIYNNMVVIIILYYIYSGVAPEALVGSKKSQSKVGQREGWIEG